MDEDDGFFGNVEEQMPQNPCEICGSTLYNNVGGFYYCSDCNTQSQHTREYATDNDQIVEIARQAMGVGVLGKKKAKKETTKRIGIKEEQIISKWEALNMLLKTMTDKLIQIGFPTTLEDKVFQLWISYLRKREVILCEDDADPRHTSSKVTLHEARANLATLLNWRKKAKRRFPKKSKSSKPKQDGEMTKTSKTRSKSKAFEASYIRTASQLQTEEDTPKVKVQKKRPPSLPFRVTSLTRKVLRAIGRENMKGSLVKNCRQASTLDLVKVERLSSNDLLTILFIACRQIGCRTLLCDFKRLVHDGTLLLNSLSEMDCLENVRISHSITTCVGNVSILKLNYFLDPYKSATDVQSMINYLGVKKFHYPEYQEFLPKFVEDSALPLEFEALLARTNKDFSIDDDIIEMGYDPDDCPWKLFIEPKIMSMIILFMLFLFGLDDITEIHQSRFAAKVNEILRKNMTQEAREDSRSEWTELFDIGEWIEYIRFRKNFLQHENIGRYNFSPHTPPNLVKTHDIWNRSGKNKNQDDLEYEMNPLDSSEQEYTYIPKRRKIIELQKLLQDAAFGANEWNPIPEIPEYKTLPLPFQSTVEEYHRSKPNVAYTNFNEELLSRNFSKKRIDFIFNPKKYIPLLNKAGYNVIVISGSAAFCKEKFKIRSKTLYLFQPFKKFESIPKRYKKTNQDPQTIVYPYSASFEFVYGFLNGYITVQDDQRQEEDKNGWSLMSFLRKLSLVYTRRCFKSMIPFRSIS